MFREILDKMRVGQNTVVDWEQLLTRPTDRLSGAEQATFQDALGIFSTNAPADKFNYQPLKDIKKPVA
jgi:hypothetical protein